jgi:hypothetical protein
MGRFIFSIEGYFWTVSLSYHNPARTRLPVSLGVLGRVRLGDLALDALALGSAFGAHCKRIRHGVDSVNA